MKKKFTAKQIPELINNYNVYDGDGDRLIGLTDTTSMAELVAKTVTVSGERTIDNVAFGGATTLSFAPDASLSTDIAEVEEGAAVSIVGAAGANLLRIGTSKCLTRAEREHFTVNGYEATQNADGWVVPKPGFRIIVR